VNAGRAALELHYGLATSRQHALRARDLLLRTISEAAALPRLVPKPRCKAGINRQLGKAKWRNQLHTIGKCRRGREIGVGRVDDKKDEPVILRGKFG
jgi:hypothetical protein